MNSVKGAVISLAGFQGVAMVNKAPYIVLSQLSFITLKTPSVLDSSSISCKDVAVYATNGKPISLQMQKQTGTTLHPFANNKNAPHVWYRYRNLSFTIPFSGKTSVHLYSLTGKLIGTPLNQKELIAGTHSMMLQKNFGSGLYLVVLDAQNVHLVGKVRIVP